MKAARYHGQRDIRIEEIAIPSPKDNEVLVEVEWCGICGSDLHEYTSGPTGIPAKGKPHVATGSTLPLTLGHEFCGRVKQTSADGQCDLKVGEAVMVDPRLCCHTCRECTSHASNMCAKLGFLGLSGGGGGGLSEVVAVDPRKCHPIPEKLLPYAALLEPLAVARHAINLLGLEDAAFKRLNILVLGGGPIGLAVIHNLLVKGATNIFVSEPSQVRREQTASLVHVIDPTTKSVPQFCMESTNNVGMDVVFDCAGIARALKDAIGAIRSKGKYINVAVWHGVIELPMLPFMFKEVVFQCSMAYKDDDFASVVTDFAAGKFGAAKDMITSRIPLDHLVEKGIEELLTNKDRQIKIVVTPKHS